MVGWWRVDGAVKIMGPWGTCMNPTVDPHPSRSFPETRGFAKVT